MAAVAYQLKSDLARVCLPAPERTAYRRLAWANSLCLFFLLIGVAGVQSRLPAQKAVPRLERPVPVIAEPLPPAAPPAAEQKPNEEDKPERPPVVAVTIDTPAINFAVPTAGSLLVPLSVAPTPEEATLKQPAPVQHEVPPATVQSTGKEGDRPAPSYPHLAEQLGYQGTVILLLTVDEAGRVVSAEIHQSSGSMILDANAQEWVKRHWIVPPVNGGHLFLAPIQYRLRAS
jgi:protein TonB